MKLKEYLKILRPGNCVMASIAVAIGYWISLGHFYLTLELAMAVVVGFLICGAGQSINDYYDRNIDKKLHPKKAIPSGKISAKNALAYSIALFAIGIVLAFFINLEAFAIALLMTVLLYAYSAVMQKHKYLGNYVVAFGTGITLVFGASISGNYFVPFVLFWPLFFANVGREITKDLEDMKADKGYKKTLPICIGDCHSKDFVFVYYFVAGIIAVYAFASGIVSSKAYLFIAIISLIVFAYSAKLLTKDSFKKSQKYSKYAMITALIAYLAAV